MEKVVPQLWSLPHLLCLAVEERRRWFASASKWCINFSSFTLSHTYIGWWILFCLFFWRELFLGFFFAVLKPGYSLYQNSNQGILYCPIKLASWLHELFLKACNNKTKGVAGVQEWLQQRAFCPDSVMLLRAALFSYAWTRRVRRMQMDRFFSYQQYCHGNPANATESGVLTKSWLLLKAIELQCMVKNEYVVVGLCQFRCCFFSVCPVVCKWDMFPNRDCSDNDLKGYFCVCSVPGYISIEFVHH